MTEAVINGSSNGNSTVQDHEPQIKSLVIPITSSKSSHASNLFIEIFPEELPQIDSSVIIKVLREEDAPLSTYADAALLYIQHRKEREGADILTAATKIENLSSNKHMRVRVLASTGIAHLTQAQEKAPVGLSLDDPKSLLSYSKSTSEKTSTSDQNDELRSTAEALFNKATNFDQLFPVTWIGKGMLNLSIRRMDAAKFFFDTTMKQYGHVLPALLGKASIHFAEKEYAKAQSDYAKAMTLYSPSIPGAGASVRVGFGLCCYRLGQVDRAKASFRRAYQMDPENVEAMVGCAVLDLASVDDTLIHGSNSHVASEVLKKTENAIKMMSMANLLDHSNAMVQNHLANHYFWKWSQVPVTVSVKQNSNVILGSQPIPLESGERVRIGQDFETVIVMEEDENDPNNTVFKVKDAWKKHSQTGLKLWKKDYDRVFSLAKGAFSSTSVQEIQAESLFILARVYHVKEDFENAHKFYEKACKLAPNLSPARFGLAQTLIWDGQNLDSAAHLRLVLGTSSTATDALACLGLLEVKKNRKEALNHLKKAVDLDPLNAELLLLEAFALQQDESDYGHALERYKKATEMMKKQKEEIHFEVWTNIGVLCQETKRFEEALDNYTKALDTLEKDNPDIIVTDTEESKEKDDDESDVLIQSNENKLFWHYGSTKMKVTISPSEGSKILTVKPEVDSDKILDMNYLQAGSHIRLGASFETKIVSSNEEKSEITIEDMFVPELEKIGNMHESSENTPAEETKDFPIYSKRSNKRIKIPSAITVAFNIARLHEAAGNILAAVELHKAIVKEHPSYVNSYLRLACISRDCSSIQNCAEWLRKACAVDPGNTEVLSLIANLHLSLCDWDPAQKIFNQLLTTKEESVEAYSQLSLGNIYFNNIHTPKKYTKNLFYAADFYRKILTKDNANAYAANGLGTILAEKGELLKAKEVFNRVREVSGDTIPDTLLNLGHIYLAQKKHPEALQMYQSYMSRTTATGAPVTSKSSEDNEVEVLMYIAFAYFDWAKQTELLNNAKAVDADDRYKKCIDLIEAAMKRSKKENVVLRYNWCRAKLQAANCVLQKPQRNIRRTAQEVQDALSGLEQSLPVVQTLVQWKSEGKRIPIASSTLNDFISHCKDNTESAKSHLSEELKKENEARELREMHCREVEQQKRDRDLEIDMKNKLAKLQEEERERKVRKLLSFHGSMNYGLNVMKT